MNKNKFWRVLYLGYDAMKINLRFARCLLHAGFMLGLLFNCEDGDTFFWNVTEDVTIHNHWGENLKSYKNKFCSIPKMGQGEPLLGLMLI
jgi:hypothetical protein